MNALPHPATRFLFALVVAAAGIPSAATDVSAQDGDGVTASRPHLGLWLGAESVPKGMVPVCGNSLGHEPGYALGVSMTGLVGRVRLRARAGRHGGTDYDCPGVFVERNGIFSIPFSRLGSGYFATTDLALLAGLGSGDWLVVGLGAGWVWSKAVPYVTSSVGVRYGRRLRVGVDLEVSSFRVPWNNRTAEYVDGSIVQVLADELYHDWGSAQSLSVLLEVPLPGNR